MTRQINLQGVGAALTAPPAREESPPFEIDNSYAFSSTPPTDPLKIAYQFEATCAGASIPTGYVFQTVLGENRYTAPDGKPALHVSKLLSILQPGFFRPARMDPTGDSTTGEFGFDMLVQFVAPLTAFVLDQNIEAGSVIPLIVT